jgi:hypothetical protein
MCLTVRGERRRHARAHAQAFAGTMRRDGALQRRFLAAIAEQRAELRATRATAKAAPRKEAKASGAGPRVRGRTGPRRTRGGGPLR